SAQKTDALPGGALDKTAFLQLLVKEMTNQDPMKPADSTQFVAQLAQFSTLEQMQNMNDGLGKLTSNFQLTQARSLLGLPVSAFVSSTGSSVNGTVDQVLTGGTIQVDVSGTPVNLTDLVSIGSGPSTTSSSS